MNISVSIQVKDNRIPQLIAAYPDMVSEVIRKATFDIEREAKGICPVDTGTLRNSINSEVQDYTGVVSTNVDYAGYVEFGTYKMAAQPYMMPAAEIVGPQFVQAIETLVRSLL